MSATVLEMKDIEKRFGGIKALQKVSMKLSAGEILAILGENGAGKSTLMKVLTGVHQADEGEIFVFGNKVNFKNYKEAQEAGISIIFQELSLIPHLTIWENIFLGNEILKLNFSLDVKKMRKASEELLARLGVSLDVDEITKNLSVAEKQFVEIAKALSVDLKILILDEPTSTLTPNEAERLFVILRDLKKQDVGIIFISHHLNELYEIADDVMILRDGMTIDQKPIASLTKDQLIEKVIGRSLGLNFPAKDYKPSEENILEVKNLQIKSDTPVINFELKKGEVLGFFGLVGSGRTELMRAIIGADQVVSKEIFIRGKKVNVKKTSKAYNFGMGIIPEDRKTEGLILQFSVGDNIYLNNKTGLMVNYPFLKKNSIEKINQLSIKTESYDTPVVNLSGGNQQKVVIARWLSTSCDILIFDEPTRGIDVGAKDEIYKIINDLAKQGKSIMVITSEMEEVIGISDRIFVLKQNNIVAELPAGTAEEKIMSYAIGGDK